MENKTFFHGNTSLDKGKQILSNLRSLRVAEQYARAGEKTSDRAEKDALFVDARMYLNVAIRRVNEWQRVGVDAPSEVIERIRAVDATLAG